VYEELSKNKVTTTLSECYCHSIHGTCEADSTHQTWTSSPLPSRHLTHNGIRAYIPG